MPVNNITLYRGTTELWEQCVIEAQLPPSNIPLHQNPLIAPQIRNNIRSQRCSLLRSGKEVVRNQNPASLMSLTAEEINREIVARVGVETAPGTPNYYSHFVPCGLNSNISNRFGHGAYYRFQVQGVMYGKSAQEIQRYVRERQTLPSYAVPLFEGGNSEVLAYTGSLITSVYLMRGESIQYWVMNSLD